MAASGTSRDSPTYRPVTSAAMLPRRRAPAAAAAAPPAAPHARVPGAPAGAGVDGAPGSPCRVQRRRALGLHRDDADAVGVPAGAPGDQPAAADGDQDGAQAGGLLDECAGDRPPRATPP